MHKVLIVDDEVENINVLRHLLQRDYALYYAKNGFEAIKVAKREAPDLILMDVMMPEMNGYAATRHLKGLEQTRHIPILIVTALFDAKSEILALECGAADYITKPITPESVKARVATHIKLTSLERLQEERLKIVRTLGRAAEYKDNETGLHVVRMSLYARALATALGVDAETTNAIYHAAPMHDIGKIGIPDHILTKPGRLTEEEFLVMKAHPVIGASIIGNDDSLLLKTARTVALTHHEKWDGSGYPHGLQGEQIPLEGRIVAVADVFDALTSRRPYKAEVPVDKALEYLVANKGKHFDPRLIEVFLSIMDEILAIKDSWAEA